MFAGADQKDATGSKRWMCMMHKIDSTYCGCQILVVEQVSSFCSQMTLQRLRWKTRSCQAAGPESLASCFCTRWATPYPTGGSGFNDLTNRIQKEFNCCGRTSCAAWGATLLAQAWKCESTGKQYFPIGIQVPQKDLDPLNPPQTPR